MCAIRGIVARVYNLPPICPQLLLNSWRSWSYAAPTQARSLQSLRSPKYLWTKQVHTKKHKRSYGVRQLRNGQFCYTSYTKQSSTYIHTTTSVDWCTYTIHRCMGGRQLEIMKCLPQFSTWFIQISISPKSCYIINCYLIWLREEHLHLCGLYQQIHAAPRWALWTEAD